MNKLDINNCTKPKFNFDYENVPKVCEEAPRKKYPQLYKQFKAELDSYQKKLFDYLLCRLNKDFAPNELKKLKQAYDLAFKSHQCQFRKTGEHEPYIVHPVEVAIIVANEMNLDLISIIGALLHDVLEDSDLVTKEDLKKEFGEPVANIVSGVTKMTKLGGTSKMDKLETFRKMIYSISKEYRVILIKIADRLHNMRTMEGMPRKTQIIKSAENLHVYAHFARAVGMFDIKNEMEDLSFKYLYPDDYKVLSQLDQTLKPYREHFLNDLKIELYKLLQPLNYNFEITTVNRSLYEIWQKLKTDNSLSFDHIHNRTSLRIVVDIDDDKLWDAAIKIFGTIAANYKFLQDSWKDYIHNPKPNGFKALIFDILYHHQATAKKIPPIAEIQILSKNGHIIAQKGANFQSIQNRVRLKDENESIIDFIDRILNELNNDFIYLYTPKGEIIELPAGSTVLDFAFKIHTELGLHCIGARINYQETKPPSFKLKSGDVVEVLTSQKITPELEWLNYVVTDKAKKAIIDHLKNKKQIPQKTEKQKHIITKNLPIVINNFSDFKLADCCNPTPEDQAVAIKDEKGNIIIHRADCTKLAAIANPEDLSPVKWDIRDSLYSIELTAMDRLGLLTDISILLSRELHINIKEIHMKINNDKLVYGKIIVKVIHNKNYCKEQNTDSECSPRDIKTLIEKLRKIDGIIDVKVKLQI